MTLVPAKPSGTRNVLPPDPSMVARQRPSLVPISPVRGDSPPLAGSSNDSPFAVQPLQPTLQPSGSTAAPSAESPSCARPPSRAKLSPIDPRELPAPPAPRKSYVVRRDASGPQRPLSGLQRPRSASHGPTPPTPSAAEGRAPLRMQPVQPRAPLDTPPEAKALTVTASEPSALTFAVRRRSTAVYCNDCEPIQQVTSE